MTAAAVWRLSLLADWHHMPMLTPKGLVVKNGLVLFVPPLSLLFIAGRCLCDEMAGYRAGRSHTGTSSATAD